MGKRLSLGSCRYSAFAAAITVSSVVAAEGEAPPPAATLPPCAPAAVPKKPASALPSKSLKDRCFKLATDERWDAPGYLACVDAFADSSGLVTLACDGPKDCKEVGELVRVNRSFRVFMWYDDGFKSVVTLDGVPGFTSTLYVPASMRPDATPVAPPARAEVDPSVPKSRTFFSPRKSGSVKLSAVATPLKADPAPELVVTVERTFVVEAYYHAAVRLGLGFSWLPTAERVDVRTAADGQRYSAVVEGDKHGLFATELTAGYSYLLCEMSGTDLKPCLGLGFRLGVLGFDSSKPRPISSLMIGLEAAVGIDLALGFYGGVARTDIPDSGYEPGRRLPAGAEEIETHIGFTPSVGVVANFTPGFLQAAGVVQ